MCACVRSFFLHPSYNCVHFCKQFFVPGLPTRSTVTVLVLMFLHQAISDLWREECTYLCRYVNMYCTFGSAERKRYEMFSFLNCKIFNLQPGSQLVTVGLVDFVVCHFRPVLRRHYKVFVLISLD